MAGSPKGSTTTTYIHSSTTSLYCTRMPCRSPSIPCVGEGLLRTRCDETEWMERLSKSWGNNDWRDPVGDPIDSRLSSLHPLTLSPSSIMSPHHAFPPDPSAPSFSVWAHHLADRDSLLRPFVDRTTTTSTKYFALPLNTPTRVSQPRSSD